MTHNRRLSKLEEATGTTEVYRPVTVLEISLSDESGMVWLAEKHYLDGSGESVYFDKPVTSLSLKKGDTA